MHSLPKYGIIAIVQRNILESIPQPSLPVEGFLFWKYYKIMTEKRRKVLHSLPKYGIIAIVQRNILESMYLWQTVRNF